jgi:hypothetical protein
MRLFYDAVEPACFHLIALRIEEIEAEADTLVADAGLAPCDARYAEHLPLLLAAERAPPCHLQHHPLR